MTDYRNYYSPRSGYWRVTLARAMGTWKWTVTNQAGDDVAEGSEKMKRDAYTAAKKVLKSAGVRVDG